MFMVERCQSVTLRILLHGSRAETRYLDIPSGYLPDIKLFIAFIHNLIPNNTFLITLLKISY